MNKNLKAAGQWGKRVLVSCGAPRVLAASQIPAPRVVGSLVVFARGSVLAIAAFSCAAFADPLSVSDRVTLLKAMQECWRNPLTAQEITEGGIKGEAGAAVEGIFKKLLSAKGEGKGSAEFRKTVKASFEKVGDKVASERVQRCFEGAFGLQDPTPKPVTKPAKAALKEVAPAPAGAEGGIAWQQLLSGQYSGVVYFRSRDDKYLTLKDDSMGVGLGRERTAWSLEPGSHSGKSGYWFFRKVDGHKRALAVMGGTRGPVQLFWNHTGNCDQCKPEDHELFVVQPTGHGTELRIRGVWGNFLIDSIGDIVASSSVGDIFVAEF